MSESSERSEELDVDQVEDCCNLDPEEIEADDVESEDSDDNDSDGAENDDEEVAPTPVATIEDGEKPMVARQGVTRQTVRKDASGGRQVVRRQQPAKQTRAQRKK